MHSLPQPRSSPDRSASALPVTNGGEGRWVVVIDHREARLFRSGTSGAIPQQILPHDPDDFFRHAYHSKDPSQGHEKPHPDRFFEPVAKELHAAGRILVVGSGKGTDIETEQFIAWLKIHHGEVAQRIVGALIVDQNHLTDDEVLGKARAFFAGTARVSVRKSM